MAMHGQAAAAMSFAGYGPKAQMSSSSCRARRGVQRAASMSSSARTATSASAHLHLAVVEVAGEQQRVGGLAEAVLLDR
jgi:hypothetical protein